MLRSKLCFYVLAAAALAAGAPMAASADTVVVTADRMVDVVAGRVTGRNHRLTGGSHPWARRTAGPGRRTARRPSGHDSLTGPDRYAYSHHQRSALHRIPTPRVHRQFLDGGGRGQRKEDRRGRLHDHPQRRVRQLRRRRHQAGHRARLHTGPRIVPATYAIGATGGHCDSTEFPPSVTVPSPQIANGPDELRATVRKLHKYGAEVIKFCGTGGVFSKTDTVGGQQYTSRK